MHTSIEQRFWSKVRKTKKCWIWTASKTAKGYGAFVPVIKHVSAHRYSYSITKGAIPKGKFVLHKCDNPSCVRPSHLYIGTVKQNVDDAIRRGRLVCKLTKSQVVKIRKLSEQGVSQRKLAIIYKVCKTTISRVVKRTHWKHVK